MIPSTGTVKARLRMSAVVDGVVTAKRYHGRVEYMVEAWADDGHPLVAAGDSQGLQRVEEVTLVDAEKTRFTVSGWDYVHTGTS